MDRTKIQICNALCRDYLGKKVAIKTKEGQLYFGSLATLADDEHPYIKLIEAYSLDDWKEDKPEILILADEVKTCELLSSWRLPTQSLHR